MRLPITIPASRLLSTLLHVVFPSTAFLVVATMFWIGFSSEREPVPQTDSEVSGATNLTYAGQLVDGSELTVLAKSVNFLPDRIQASDVQGKVNFLGGRVATFTSEKANAGWDMSYAGFEIANFKEEFVDGSTLEVWMESGSADSNGLSGTRVSATHLSTRQLKHELTAGELFLKSDRSYATLSDGATVKYIGEDASDWLAVSSAGFELRLNQSEIESTDAAEFEFQGGSGKTGLLKVLNFDSPTEQVVELLDGVEITFLEILARN